MLVLLEAAASVHSIAFLGWFKDHVFLLTLICISPALLFTGYVLFDDARQARAHRHEAAKGGGTPTH
jgi:hypothetical protein